jgi:hypothetical protein
LQRFNALRLCIKIKKEKNQFLEVPFAKLRSEINIYKMYMKTFKIISFVLFTTLFVASCSIEECHADYDDGNANVASGVIDVYARDWVYRDPSWVLTINYNMITRGIIDYGAVLVYMQDGNAYRQLPLTMLNMIETETGSYYYSTIVDVDTYVGAVDIYWTESDFYNSGNPGQRRFKVVAIAASDYYKNADIDYSDYNQVKEAYNLAD